jgi:hypothetical protein
MNPAMNRTILILALLAAVALRLQAKEPQRGNGKAAGDTPFAEITKTLTFETDSTFVSPIRPNITLRLGEVCTDIFEYVEYKDGGDFVFIFVKKDDVVFRMEALSLWEELPDWVSGEKYMIKWKIGTMHGPDDYSEEGLWAEHFAVKATPMNDLYRVQATHDFKDFELYPLGDTIVHDLNGDGVAERVFLNGNDNIIIADGGTGTETTFDDDGFSEFSWVNYWGVTTDGTTYHIMWETPLNEPSPQTENVQLLYPSVFVRKLDGGGGTITFRDGKYIWIHQND